MTTKTHTRPIQSAPVLKRSNQFAFRLGRYFLVKTLSVAVTLLVGVYVAVIISNLGGYIDDLIRDRIQTAIQGRMLSGWLADASAEERDATVAATIAQMEDAAGLNTPFLWRCLIWTFENLTFKDFNLEIRERLPNTLLLFGTANVLLFVFGILLALNVSRKYGGWLDRLVVGLSPISSMPAWVHGVILVMIFAVQLKWFPTNTNIAPLTQVITSMIEEQKPEYLLMIARYMALPVLAIFLSLFFQTVYTWRTFFLIYADEDYVDVGRAKGLHPIVLERRYILRPTMPYIVTNMALVLIGFWQTSIALEYFFYWPGIGSLYIASVGLINFNASTIMQLMTLFAYLLAITMLVLDLLYALMDPRVTASQQSEGGARVTLRERLLYVYRSLFVPAPAKQLLTSAAQANAPLHAPKRRRDKNLLLATSATLIAWGVIAWDRLAGVRSPKTAQSAPPKPRKPSPNGLAHGVGRNGYSSARQTLNQILGYPSALIGFAGILVLIGVSIYTVIAIPYDQMARRWVSDDWWRNPEAAMPTWTNYFRLEKLPETIQMSTLNGTASKTRQPAGQNMDETVISMPFEYNYDDFPQELLIILYSTYDQKKPHVSMSLFTPDGREINMGTFSITSELRYYASQDATLKRRLDGIIPRRGLFVNPDLDPETIVKGRYELRISVFTFEPDSDVDAEMNLIGQVYGLAGTDHRRRDLSLALLWGAPIALGLGLIASFTTTFVSMLVAAVGVWFGGWVDQLVQFVTEVNVILPILPVAIMAYYLYGKNVWIVLGTIIIFSILGTSTKNYRAAFLQVKALPFIEAARAYGASSWRIVLRYLVPRILPATVPQLVALVPGFVFLEATLAILKVSDPYIPTWGSMIYDALVNGAFRGKYYWILQPVVLLMFTGMAFALVGFALDRIFNPRLRKQ